MTRAKINAPTPLKTPAAHALVRAVFALLRTQVSGIDHSVHTSVKAGRMSACAAWASRPIANRERKGVGAGSEATS
jgi:hypothetical protein